MSELEQRLKTICFDLVGRIQDIEKVAYKQSGVGALIEPDAINNHVNAILAAHRAEADKRFETAIGEPLPLRDRDDMLPAVYNYNKGVNDRIRYARARWYGQQEVK